MMGDDQTNGNGFRRKTDAHIATMQADIGHIKKAQDAIFQKLDSIGDNYVRDKACRDHRDSIVTAIKDAKSGANGWSRRVTYLLIIVQVVITLALLSRFTGTEFHLPGIRVDKDSATVSADILHPGDGEDDNGDTD